MKNSVFRPVSLRSAALCIDFCFCKPYHGSVGGVATTAAVAALVDALHKTNAFKFAHESNNNIRELNKGRQRSLACIIISP